MTRLTYYRVKNAMLFAGMVSNLVGVAIVRLFTERSALLLPDDIMGPTGQIDRLFVPASFLLPLVLILVYERPIRAYLKARYERRTPPPALVASARRRLLNEPFFLIGISFCMWMAAAAVYPTMLWAHGAEPAVVRSAFLRSIFTGLNTITVAFFVLEFVLQRRVIPHFFPDGGLSAIPGTLRIRIRTRLTAFLCACNIVPLLSIWQSARGQLQADEFLVNNLEHFQSNLIIQVIVFMAAGLWLTFLVSSNLTKPLREITAVLRQVQDGRFETRVRVTSNDEIGYTGDVINAMADGLAERDRIKQSLALAKEVQQLFFPQETMALGRLEAAGRSVYSDETGGDYFDFIPLPGAGSGRLGVAIGDVSGHGISSALLMATVRSALRQRASHPGSAAQIISDVNRQLVQDIEHSGEFVTLFFLVIDAAGGELSWVRAGHDPAILYDPQRDGFEELGGPGMAVGVDRLYAYAEQKRAALPPGGIILLGTDGIWEATDPKGKRFGKQPVFDALRRHCRRSAGEIRDAVLDAQAAFRRGTKREDDTTLVVVKNRP